MPLDLIRDPEEAARIAVSGLPEHSIRRIACMCPHHIPLLLEDDLEERCGPDGAEYLQHEIHKLCCERAGVKAA